MRRLCTTAQRRFSEPAPQGESGLQNNRLNIDTHYAINVMAESSQGPSNNPVPVGADELNSWKRGFTPQAEIWNGRLAMVGLSAGLGVVLIARVFTGT